MKKCMFLEFASVRITAMNRTKETTNRTHTANPFQQCIYLHIVCLQIQIKGILSHHTLLFLNSNHFSTLFSKAQQTKARSHTASQRILVRFNSITFDYIVLFNVWVCVCVLAFNRCMYVYSYIVLLRTHFI